MSVNPRHTFLVPLGLVFVEVVQTFGFRWLSKQQQYRAVMRRERCWALGKAILRSPGWPGLSLWGTQPSCTETVKENKPVDDATEFLLYIFWLSLQSTQTMSSFLCFSDIRPVLLSTGFSWSITNMYFINTWPRSVKQTQEQTHSTLSLSP